MTKPTTALEAVLRWEREMPDRIWLTQPVGNGRVETLTFRQALDEARRMAAHLKSLGLPEKSHIALLSKNCAHWLLTDLAIWMAGHVSIPLYPTLTADTVAKILDHSEARLIFIGKLDDYDEMKGGIPKDMPRIALPLNPGEPMTTWRELVAKTAPLAGDLARAPDDLATIIYTSGSTGAPKGVMHSFRTMGQAVEHFPEVVPVGSDDRMLSYLPLAHAFERWLVEMGTYWFGWQLFFAESLDTFLVDLRRARPTLFISVPRLWLKFQAGVFHKMPPKKLERLLKIPIVSGIVKKKILVGLGLDSVKHAGSGSAPLPAEVISWYRRLGLELLEGYGMTENFSYSHGSRPGRVRVGYVGHPQPHVEQRISDAGEVLVKSPGTMLGYYKAPELTREMIDDEGWLHTGDRGELDVDGRLRITGRVKDLFKTSKGKYVAPVPIENVLLSHPFIAQACVAGVGQPQPHAVVVLSDDARRRSNDEVARELEALRAKVNATLDPHEHLELIAVAKDEWTQQNGFLTPTEKLKRACVEDAYQPRWDEWYRKKQTVVLDA